MCNTVQLHVQECACLHVLSFPVAGRTSSTPTTPLGPRRLEWGCVKKRRRKKQPSQTVYPDSSVSSNANRDAEEFYRPLA